MKSVSFYSFLLIAAIVTGCTANEEEPPAAVKNGKWAVTNIEQTRYDSLGKFVGFTSTSYLKGERTIEFNETDKIYSEFENGAVTRSGPYAETGDPTRMVAIINSDSVKLKIWGLTRFTLVVQTEEKNASGATTRIFETERRKN